MWLGLLGSFFAYILYFFLIAHLGATVSTPMVTYMFPVVGVTLGVVVLGGGPRRAASARCRLVVLGIAIVGLRYDAVVSLATRVARR